MRKKGKGRGFAAASHRLEYGGSRTCFSFRIYRKHQGFRYFGEIGKMMRKEGKEDDRQQGLLLASIGNIRGGAYFRGKDEGEGRERRGFLKSSSFSLFFPLLW